MEWGDALTTFRSQTLNKCPLHRIFSAPFLTFFFFFGNFLFNMVPKHDVELFSALKCDNVVMCLRDKCVLDKLCSNISFSTIGHEFDINK